MTRFYIKVGLLVFFILLLVWLWLQPTDTRLLNTLLVYGIIILFLNIVFFE
jgi:hypothetical protein